MDLRLAPCALRGSFRSEARINADSCTRRAASVSSRRTARPSATGSFRSEARISADSHKRRAADLERSCVLSLASWARSFRSEARISANSCTRRAADFSRRRRTTARVSSRLPGLKSGARHSAALARRSAESDRLPVCSKTTRLTLAADRQERRTLRLESAGCAKLRPVFTACYKTFRRGSNPRAWPAAGSFRTVS